MEGRVEVCQNQTWWAVSGSYYWDYSDATVVCRHLHYPANCEWCNSIILYAGKNSICHLISHVLVHNFKRSCYTLVCMQGQFPCPLHSLGEAMLQYWFRILDVLVERSHSSSVHPTTTPSPLTTLVAIMYITGMFTQLNISCYI